MKHKISEQFKKDINTLKDRGIPKDSYFEVVFEDGSILHEDESNWSEFSEQKVVNFFDKKKIVMLSKYPVKSITIKLGSLTTQIIPKKGQFVYQAIRQQDTLFLNDKNNSRLVGRVVGIVEGDRVIEERFLNGQTGEVKGFKL